MESFAQIVKRELSLYNDKQNSCCLINFLYGIMYFSEIENDYYVIKTANAENKNYIIEVCSFVSRKADISYFSKGTKVYINKGFLRFSTIAEIKEHLFKCKDCQSFFLKAIFILRGTVNSPEKPYRLEIVFNNKNDSEAIAKIMSDINTNPKKSIRKGRFVLYLKENEKVEDFLAYIGAKNASFTLINKEIVKDMRNNANRATNCDSANINKSLMASEKYISVINKLIESGKIELLSPQLKEMAFKRLEFKELNLSDLGAKFSPPMSKSGVYHRLERIVKFYENLKK